MTDYHKYTNRLIREKSLYLLQHAHNPVDWYSWGEEAFKAAKEQDKPIFLSIGYATCHWCHVMEQESFDNPEIAKEMNANFINVKVDREEMPEVDNLYMEFAQSMMAGAAGWPLNLLLTPDSQPFFATTYLPPRSAHGLIGLRELIDRIKEIWDSEEREKILMQASKIVDVFATQESSISEEIPEPELIENGAEMIFQMADPVYGGMKGSPKFPVAYQISFMLYFSSRMKEARALFLVERNLDMMHRGGIFDHLGGGFSRYSVDEHWLIPHFEKMLYDNAILANSYLEAWQVTKRPLYRSVSEEILNYLLREMRDPDGGFYSAEDADSEGHEGRYYTWEYDEVVKILEGKTTKKNVEIFCEFYGITPEGNFEGRNVLNSPKGAEEFALKNGINLRELLDLLTEQKKILFDVRSKREHPLKDDKIVTSWNGLAIYAFIRAGVAFENQSYVQAAIRAAEFIRSHLWKEGHLLRRWREGEALHSGGLEDYAFLIRGLLSLFEAHCGVEWLKWALDLANVLDTEFKADGAAFYQTDGRDPSIILRKSRFPDGAEPSGNAIQCENLLRLYQITLDQDYLNQALDVLKAAKNFIENYPPGYCYHLMNLQRYYDRQALSIVIALNEQKQFQDELLHLLSHSFLPHKSIIWREVDDRELFNLIPFIRNQLPLDGKTTLYICQKGICEKPLTDLAEMIDAIHKI